MIIELRPPHGAGPVDLGMPLNEAREQLVQLPGYVPPAPGAPVSPTYVHYESGLSIGLGPQNGRIISIEFYNPWSSDDVVYDGISLFREPADQLIDLLAERTRLDISRDRLFVVAPDLLLAFARTFLPEEDEEGRYFGSVLLSAPGYYAAPDGRPTYADDL